MTLLEQVFAQAVILAGGVEKEQEPVLQALCRAAVNSLSARLRPNLSPEDCKADFIAAASLYALSALETTADVDLAAEFRAGDLTVKRGGSSAASQCLYTQAELMIAPYLEDRFAFLGV